MSGEKASAKSPSWRFLSRELRALLKLRKVRQNQLARAISADPKNVNKWVTGKVVPNAVWLVKMADYLNVSLDQLCGRTPPGGDSLAEIRKHAQRILALAGGIPPGPRQRQKKTAKD